MWANAAFYKSKFLLGRPPAIPLAEFPYWSRTAETRVNCRRVKVSEPGDELRLCVCEVAEIMYSAAQGPKPGELISESNASYSWKAQEARTDSETSAEIDATVKKYLAGGVYHNDFVSRAV